MKTCYIVILQFFFVYIDHPKVNYEDYKIEGIKKTFRKL